MCCKLECPGKILGKEHNPNLRLGGGGGGVMVPASLEGVAKPGRWMWCLGVELVRSSLDQLWDLTMRGGGGAISPLPPETYRKNF